jgi:hypothetical protein
MCRRLHRTDRVNFRLADPLGTLGIDAAIEHNARSAVLHELLLAGSYAFKTALPLANSISETSSLLIVA